MNEAYLKTIKEIQKGVTIIELIIVMAIMSMVFISLAKFIKSTKWYENKINVDFTGNSIMMFINRSKQYCKLNKCSGLIVIDVLGNELEFYKNKSILIEEFQPPKNMKISRFSDNKLSLINIDKNGSTTDACSIYYKDGDGTERKVSIRVGSEYTHVYK